MKALAVGAAAVFFVLLSGTLALVAFVVVAAGGAGSASAAATVSNPSEEAIGDIPALLLELFTAEAQQCPGLPWQVMAGISKVESNHGRYGGSTIALDGTVRPPIVGIALDGTNGTARIPDSDGGVWDGDTVWDRAVGPFQFIPSSWRIFGDDGNDDGRADPNNVHDAVGAMRRHLCPDGRLVDIEAAVFSYNRSNAYVAQVLEWARRYTGPLATSAVPVAGYALPLAPGLARGLAAVAAIAALIAAVPVLLWRFGGSPGVDIIDAFGDPLASEQARTETLLAGTLATIAWLCWAQVAYALAIETLATIRGKAARRAPVLPGIQTAAGRLVATATLIITPFTQTTAAIAAPLAPIDVDAPAPVVLLHDLPNNSTVDLEAAPETTAGSQSYVVAERDTFWSIAETTLGDGLRWQEIRDANIGHVMADGTTITASTEATRPGWTLQLPPDAITPVAFADSASTELGTTADADHELEAMVEVEQGDHFWSLATDALAAEWGRTPTDTEVAPYWAGMVALNQYRLLPPDDPNLIYPNQVFELPPLPADPTAPATTETPPSEPAEPVAPAPPVEQAEPEPLSTLPPPPTPPTNVAPAPTPPATEVPAAEASPAETNARDTGGSVSYAVVAGAGIGALAVASGAVAVTLRRRRAHQAAKRQPQTTIEAPSPEASDYERRTRPVADTEAARWVEATNKLITLRCTQHPEARLPTVTAIRAGRFGVEVLLDEASAPLEGFVAANERNTAWRVHPDLELRMLETETGGTQPYSPALTCIGTTEAGDLFVDLEQLAAVAVDGPTETVTGWFRGIALGVAANPWSQYCETIAVGLPDDFAAIERVTTPDDPQAWCQQTVTSMRKLHERLTATPYEQRVNPGEVFHPTVALIGPEHPELARQLTEVASLINTPFVVLAATPLPTAEVAHINHGHGTLEPSGINFTPVITEPSEAKAINELLDNATAAASIPPEPAQAPEPEAESDMEVEPVDDVIARVLTPRPVEIKILAPMPSASGLDPEPATKQLAVITYLAYHRTVTSTRLRETFWPNATNRSTPDNAISQIRRILGVDSDGENRLAQAINTGQYELSDEIGCDWTRAQQLIHATRGRADGEELGLLRAALELIDGQIGSDAPARQFAWLCEDHSVYSHIETTLVDAADRLGAIALANGDPETAAWAVERGLAVVPGNEAMYRLQMRAAAAAGEPKAVEAAYDQAQRSASDLGPWVEVDDETDALYDDLTGRSEAQAS